MLSTKSILTAAIALAALFATGSARADGVFTLSSAAFKDGERLPTRFAGNHKANPNCPGENISPPLAWANPPEGTRSYALFMIDVDARPPGGSVHWLAYGIPAAVTSFAEGEVSKPSDKYVGGQSTYKLANYTGPCPGPGAVHHYVFTLMASDLEPSALKGGMTRDEAITALGGHAKAATSLVGTFSKQ
jgi:Raf kinase inhibitor-like YbhB/YbcL family protein